MGVFAHDRDFKAFQDDRKWLSLSGDEFDSTSKEITINDIQVKLRNANIVEGRNGKAIQLSGKDSRIEINGLKAPENAFSLAFWMKLDRRVDAFILPSSWGSHPTARLRGNSVQGSYYRGSPVTSAKLSTEQSQKGEWVHLTFTYDETIKVYINGKMSDWTIKNVNERRAYLKDIKLFEEMPVTVDDLAIFNKSLNQNEIDTLMKP
jgi:hypothetical protein